MPGRSFVGANGYKYGFNGKEKDDEVSGNGNQYDYGFRIYNPQLGRFLSVDPLSRTFPWYTPYQFAGNKPIVAIDLDGLEEFIIHNIYDEKNKVSLVRIYRYIDAVGKTRDNNVHKDGKKVTDKKVMVLHYKADGSKYQEPTYQDELTKTQSKILKSKLTVATPITDGTLRYINAGEDGIGQKFSDGSLLKTEGVPTVTVSPPEYTYSPKGIAPFYHSGVHVESGDGPVTGIATSFLDFAVEEGAEREILITGTKEFKLDFTKQLLERGVPSKNILTIDKIPASDKSKFEDSSKDNGFFYIKKEKKK
ncbi:MAG: RHS repeat-associated core domain-containing protein [Bacteroidota bacterium]